VKGREGMEEEGREGKEEGGSGTGREILDICHAGI